MELSYSLVTFCLEFVDTFTITRNTLMKLNHYSLGLTNLFKQSERECFIKHKLVIENTNMFLQLYLA